jgi:hypothetical protein
MCRLLYRRVMMECGSSRGCIGVATMYPQMRKYWYYLLLKHNDVQFSPSPAPAQESMIKGPWWVQKLESSGSVGVGWGRLEAQRAIQ